MVSRLLAFLFALVCLILIGSMIRADEPPLYSPFSTRTEPVGKKEATPSKPVVPKLTPVEVARKEAEAKGQPLVVFVAVPVRQIAGAVVIRDDTWQAKACVTVHTFGSSGYGVMFPSTVDDGTIRHAAGLAVSPQAVPFVKSPVQSTAEGKPHARQLPSWFPKDAVRYKPAKYTQRVFNRDQTERVDRSNLEPKWNVPGGLENVAGWRSDLYRYVPSAPRVWRGDIEVWAGNYWQWGNGATVRNDDGTPKKSYQTEMAWQRSYPVGSWFADVLSTNGNIFEVRVREKQEWGWDSYVAFRDARHRPSGYSGLSSRSCNECHSRAGSGGYAVGWVPGGDDTISDPFEGLES